MVWDREFLSVLVKKILKILSTISLPRALNPYSSIKCSYGRTQGEFLPERPDKLDELSLFSWVQTYSPFVLSKNFYFSKELTAITYLKWFITDHIQGVQDQNVQIQTAFKQNLCSFDPKLVNPKWVWEIYIFSGRVSF